MLLILLWASRSIASAETPVEIGRRIYREGMLPGDKPVVALIQGDIVVSGQRAACIHCHQRSGYGVVEGNQVVPPITARSLFQPRPVQGSRAGLERPAYRHDSLRRALHDGINPNGRTLQAPMPRYVLEDSEMSALIQYLQSLTANPPAGVTNEALHLATIVTDAVPAQQRRALLGVLDKYIQDKNADIRLMQRGGFGHSQLFRSWQLHVWELHGNPATWGEQLEQHFRQQPVFAVLGGVGNGSWREIHRRCEHLALPCLLPNTDEPFTSQDYFYSMYFTRGIEQEADVLAQHLREHEISAPRRIVQIYRKEMAGETAAARLQHALAEVHHIQLQDRAVAGNTPIDAVFWQDVFASRADSYVLWLADNDLAAIDKQPDKHNPTIYISSSHVPHPAATIQPALRKHTSIVQLHELPAMWQQQRTRLDNWLRVHQLAQLDERIEANTTQLLSLFNLALSHLQQEDLSGEQLIERLEHLTPITHAWPSRYPQFSLGAGQHVGSQGGYVVPMRADGSLPHEARWIIPQGTQPRVQKSETSSGIGTAANNHE
jgi:hypothetical protein